jgi:hypothetical protein
VTWHRLYTYNMEQSLIQHSVNTLAMPYWDWTNPPNSNLILPQLALKGEWTDGPIEGKDRVTHRNFTSIGTDYLRGLVKTAFKQTIYVQFNQQIVIPHNFIHVRVGGDMGAPLYASYDPIFFLHHSYVDLQFAYYQELQKLRLRHTQQKSFCIEAQTAQLQPFPSSEVNPYKPYRDNSIGYQTLDYKKKFCYDFEQLLFDGLTPEQFIAKEEEELKQPSILAAVPMNSTGYASTVTN